MDKDTFYVPHEAKAGDILAFNTKGLLSTLIRFFSIGINHTEIVAQNPNTGNLECFSADSHGTRFKSIESAVRDADGSVYYLELREDVRKKLNEEAFGEKVIQLQNLPYDVLHFLGVAIDDWHIDWLSIFPKIPKWILKTLKGMFQNTETMAKVVCSGCAAWAFKAGLKIKVNASEEMPLNVCQYNLYKTDFITLKGKNKGISGYNKTKVL